ncbi:MAG: hypothetical protein ABGY21_12455 [Pseudomonadota bacterium]
MSLWLNGGLFGGGGPNVHGGYMQGTWQYVSSTKYDFVTETYVTLSNAITNLAGYSATAISNNQVAGYSCTGIDSAGNRTTRSWKITVADNTFTDLGTNAVEVHQLGFGYSNSGVAGYYGGGVPASGPYNLTIEKFAYSSDTSCANISGTIDAPRYYQAGMAKSGDRGMSCGGWNGVNSGSAMTYVSFATDTSGSMTAISTGTYGQCMNSNGQVAGYVSGGYNLGSAIDKFDYSTFSRSTLSATAGAGYVTGWPNTSVAGYWSQGAAAVNQFKLDFSSDTVSTPSGTMGSPWANGSPVLQFSSCEASP